MAEPERRTVYREITSTGSVYNLSHRAQTGHRCQICIQTSAAVTSQEFQGLFAAARAG